MAMDDDSLCVGPGIDELSDRARVILAEENIRRLSPLDDVGETQIEYRDKVTGELRRLRVRVRDGNADFPLAWLVALSILSREYDKVRNSFLSLRHRSTTLPPLRDDGQVAHDYEP